jgi:hypothetical protein
VYLSQLSPRVKKVVAWLAYNAMFFTLYFSSDPEKRNKALWFLPLIFPAVSALLLWLTDLLAKDKAGGTKEGPS